MSRPQLEVELVRGPERATVLLRGELDLAVEPEATAAIDAAVATGGGVALDLRDLDFIDSWGLKVVVQTFRLLRDRGTAFVVVRGPEHVQRPFRSAGLEDLLPFVDAPPA